MKYQLNWMPGRVAIGKQEELWLVARQRLELKLCVSFTQKRQEKAQPEGTGVRSRRTLKTIVGGRRASTATPL
jgi:hypothetical protein